MAGILSSCEKKSPKIISYNEQDFAIEEATNWIETNGVSTIQFSSPKSKGHGIPIETDWSNYSFNSFNSFFTIELNLITKGRFGFAFEEGKEAYNLSKDERYLRTLTRLVLKISRDLKETIGFYMTFIPSKTFREEYNFGRLNSTYLNINSKFSGYVLYHNIDGSFANGWKYDNGNIVKAVSLSINQKLLKSSKDMATTCEDIYAEVWYQDCTDWYSVTETTVYFIGTSCGAPYSEIEYLYTECPESYSGGGGGQYIPPDPQEIIIPGPYMPEQGDTFFQTKFSINMPTQLPNGCVTSIMEYINQELCSGTTSDADYIMDYLNTYGTWVPRDGVTLQNLENFVNRHFITTPFSGYTNAINWGQVVMADIESNISGSAHNVAVVGYHPDGSLIYMDPEKGSLQQASASDVGLNYSIPIITCK